MTHAFFREVITESVYPPEFTFSLSSDDVDVDVDRLREYGWHVEQTFAATVCINQAREQIVIFAPMHERAMICAETTSHFPLSTDT